MKKKKINVKAIPPEPIVNVPMSGTFYQRLNKLLIEFGDSEGKEGLVKAMLCIKHNKAETDNFAYNLETLIILLQAVEEAFEKEGHINDSEIEIDVPDDFDSKN
jgi:hypothetical protein